MAMRAKRQGARYGVKVKKKLLLKGFELLRRLAQGPLSRDDAERELGIPYRDWYRWLQIFAECEIPLAEDYRIRRGRAPERTLRLWPQDWHRLIDRLNKKRR